MYPIMLRLAGKRCIVVGGGGVALRKVEGLLEEQALVTVVAPAPMGALRSLAEAGRVALEVRGYRPGEAADYALAFAATDDREVNRQVFEDASRAGIWVNVADDPELCSFHLPARVQRGPLQIAVASAGEAPFVVRRLRQLLERRFGPEWGAWVDAAARFRARVRESRLTPAEQEARYDAFFGATVDREQLRARVPLESEQVTLLGAPRPSQHEPAALPGDAEPVAAGPTPTGRGLVSLVGAGPGDPRLLTLRARDRLFAADVVVCDRLAIGALPAELPDRIAIHGVGKEAGHHPVPQEEITALLVRLGRAGLRVVRLKGGDPYVFGRGGEEGEELARAGVPFEIVPGVTSGIAAPAYVGIPVTHRREAVRVSLVTAHEAVKRAGPQVRWDLLASDPNGTIVGYMGVSALPTAVRELLAYGMAPTTPAAVVHRGTTSAQRVVHATLETVEQAVRDADIGPPALFVIGATARHAAALDWRARLPLRAERIVLSSPAGPLGDVLDLAGAELVPVPLPLTAAARFVAAALPITACVLRSRNEADAFDDERDGPTWGRDVLALCLGPTVAERARELGWPRVLELDAQVDGADLVAKLTAARGRFAAPA